MSLSPLTYPGGKSSQSEAIAAALHLSKNVAEYREPFIGGGSVALLISAIRPDIHIWVNDLNPQVANFWQVLKFQGETLASRAERLLPLAQDSALLSRKIERLRNSRFAINQAAGWFALNRCTYGGLGDFGGISPNRGRFTYSAIAKLRAAIPLLQRWTITSHDYARVLSYPGQNIAIFCDPPYREAASKKLYLGHQFFDWTRFSDAISQSCHQILATLDDCPENRQLFQGDRWCITDCSKFYGLSKSRKPEIWVSNYRRTVANQLTLV